MMSCGKIIGTVLVLLGLCSAAQASDAPPWGAWRPDRPGPVMVGTQVKLDRFTPVMAELIKATGFRFVRVGVWVNSMQARDYQLKVDSALQTARDAGLTVLLTVRSTAPLVQNASDDAARDAQLRDAAAALTGTVTALADQYGDNLLAIELWNEPDLPTYWPTGAVETTFPVYMRAVCQGLEPLRASTTIIGFGFSAPPVPGSLPDRLLRSMGRSPHDCIDAISYHAYGMNEQQIRDASAWIRSHYGLPAAITEWGISSAAKGGLTAQASGIGTFLKVRSLLETSLVSLYEWQDSENAATARDRNFGLLDAAGATKPAYDAALRAMRLPESRVREDISMHR
jgi:polysaccharide biosynthesis protein PslG